MVSFPYYSHIFRDSFGGPWNHPWTCSGSSGSRSKEDQNDVAAVWLGEFGTASCHGKHPASQWGGWVLNWASKWWCFLLLFLWCLFYSGDKKAGKARKCKVGPKKNHGMALYLQYGNLRIKMEFFANHFFRLQNLASENHTVTLVNKKVVRKSLSVLL